VKEFRTVITGEICLAPARQYLGYPVQRELRVHREQEEHLWIIIPNVVWHLPDNIRELISADSGFLEIKKPPESCNSERSLYFIIPSVFPLCQSFDKDRGMYFI